MERDNTGRRRRALLAGLAVAATAGMGLADPAWSQAPYPDRPVKLLVGFPPGSSTDVAARALAAHLSTQFGHQVVVENRPGATSNIAAKAAAAAPADGLTLFVGTIANTISTTLQPAVSADLLRDFDSVAMIGSVPNLLVAHPSLGVDNFAQLLARAKAEPGRISYASSGNGTSPHLSGELLATMADLQLLHVPYKGSSQAVTDLLAGQVQIMFAPASTVLAHIRSGRLKALAATGLQRADSMPDLPTVDELGLRGFETSVWFGLNAPRGTPPAIVERLRAAVLQAQASPELQAQFRQQGIDMVRAGPADYSAQIRRETEKWARVIRLAKVTAD